MKLDVGNLLYEGKAKDIYETSQPQMVIVKFRDDITAGDGKKKEVMGKKGYYNSLISAKLFLLLENAGIKTQYLDLLEPGYMLCHQLEMIPMEVITRNLATGSLIRRFPFQEGQTFDPPLIQMDYKNDEYHDPMLNDDITLALGLATKEELQEIREITVQINQVLKDFLESKGLLFPDFKIEYGWDNRKNLVLGDEISPDTCRFWDRETCDILDKDLFRMGKQGVIKAYQKVTNIILDEKDKKRWNLDF